MNDAALCAAGRMVDYPVAFRTTPLGYYLWSRSPRASHVLACAIARFADPSFRWLSIRESPSLPAEEERWVHRMLPENRIVNPISPSDLGRTPRFPRRTFDSMIRPDGAEAERIALNHFFLLPQRLQSMLDEPNPSPGPRVVVVANTNWVREFYPTDPERLRAYTDVFPRTGFSMITTSIPPPYRGRYGFDIVLRLDVPSALDWRTATLVVEKGPRTGDFRTGASLSSDRIPGYLELGASIEKLSA